MACYHNETYLKPVPCKSESNPNGVDMVEQACSEHIVGCVSEYGKCVFFERRFTLYTNNANTLLVEWWAWEASAPC